MMSNAANNLVLLPTFQNHKKRNRPRLKKFFDTMYILESYNEFKKYHSSKRNKSIGVTDIFRDGMVLKIRDFYISIPYVLYCEEKKGTELPSFEEFLNKWQQYVIKYGDSSHRHLWFEGHYVDGVPDFVFEHNEVKLPQLVIGQYGNNGLFRFDMCSQNAVGYCRQQIQDGLNEVQTFSLYSNDQGEAA